VSLNLLARKSRRKNSKPASLDLDKDLIRFIPFCEMVSIATARSCQKSAKRSSPNSTGSGI
jgi:hypothetical protein